MKTLMYNRDDMQSQLEGAMNSELEITRNSGTLYNDLAGMGHHSPIFLAVYYREYNILETAESVTRREVESAGYVLGVEHPVVSHLKSVLSSILFIQGRWQEAEKLDLEVMDMFKRVGGEERPTTLTSMHNLVSTYRNQGKWKEAQELGRRVMEMKKRVLGEEHPSTLTSMASLASTYRN